jgi:biotin carboxylase
MKPLRGHLSMYSYKVKSLEEAREKYYIHRNELNSLNLEYQKLLLSSLPQKQKTNELDVNNMICEEYLEGDQLTVDLCVYKDQVKILGMTESVYHSEYASFTRFEYPYTYSREVEQILNNRLYKLINQLELNNTLLNIELKYDRSKKSAKIIEINTRMSFQFVNLIKAVTGINLIKIASEISTNQKPSLSKISTPYSHCFSLVLRKKEDMLVAKTPSPDRIRQIALKFPEAKVTVLVKRNQKLSDLEQDTQSYRYCIIDIPGISRQDIFYKLKIIEGLLDFEFQEVAQKINSNKLSTRKVMVRSY